MLQREESRESSRVDLVREPQATPSPEPETIVESSVPGGPTVFMADGLAQAGKL